MYTILVSAPYIILNVERFKPIFNHYGIELLLADVHERLSEEYILSFAGQFDGALCGDDRFSARVLQACWPRLKVISKWGTGIDSIDSTAAERLGIQVLRTLNAFTMPVADTVIGYILAFARRLPWMDQAMKTGRWEKITGRSLSECTLGVIGVGNCGKAVLRRARAFGMKLLGNDIISIAPDFVMENCVEMTSLDDLLHRADYISLNCDLNPTSLYLINADKLRLMKPTAVVINTARGSIINEAQLIQALQDGVIAGAALDVFEVEPLPSTSPLLRMSQVMLAPHNANSSPIAWERVHWSTIRNLLDGLKITHDDLESIAERE